MQIRQKSGYVSELSPEYNGLLSSPECNVLSRQEELELARIAFSGDVDARGKLLKANLRFVVFIARKYANQARALDISFEDLVSVGNASLAKALERYDPLRFKKGRLSSYAARVMGYDIRYYLFKGRSTISIPKGHNPFGVFLVDWNFQPYRNSKLTLAETFSSSDEVSISDKFEIKEDSARALKLIGTLDSRTREMIFMRYGLNGFEPTPLNKIGILYNLSPEGVRLIIKKGLEKIRKKMH
ncbi:sigma-70 family RNA polymerase sigma factor [Candidatus Pacearchaeota archaeon]|nr:sigma-70 family RNA polymerase sigma factor [Candidatus Pacearchaeota archaeon]